MRCVSDYEENYPMPGREGRTGGQGCELWGFIDKTGKVVIPCQWKYGDTFSEGLAKVTDVDGKCGFIDKTGKVVIPCLWEDAWSFSEGLAQVKDADGQWWIIDKTGKVVKKVE